LHRLYNLTNILEMRRTVLVIMILCGAFTASAQFGIKGGLTANSLDLSVYTSDGEITNTTKTTFHAGVFYKLPLSQWFTLQPELLYVQKKQGLRVEDYSTSKVTNLEGKFDYIQLPVNVQFGLNLVVARPFIFASPFIGYAVSVADAPYGYKASDFNRFAYGVGMGAGVDIWKLQFTIKYGWDFQKNGSSSMTPAEYRNAKNRGLDISLGFFF